MRKEFLLEILTPGREVVGTDVSEVVLPAYDGERGILADHEDFIGTLGTGPVKIVKDANDYWFLVSGGVYEVRGGKLTLYAELAETAEEVDPVAAEEVISGLSEIFSDPVKFRPNEYPAQMQMFNLNRARIEVCRRTESVH